MTTVTPRLDRPTHRRVLVLALPMTLADVTTPMLGFVGAARIGRMGDAALLADPAPFAYEGI